MSDRTLAQQLGAFAAAVDAASLPEAVDASVRRRVLDVVGICVRATELDTSRAVAEHVAEQGGTAAATGIGLGARVPAAAAAFLNGVLAHSLDYDDTHLPSVLHPSASVVPAALAAAEAAGADGAATLAAIAVGIEVTIRIGMAGYLVTDGGGRNEWFEHGQHATSICGALGSAAAAAMLVGHDRPRAERAELVTQAVAVAASMSSGVIEANRTGGTVKRLHCGLAAQAGVSAAQLVARGLTGAPTALEGRFGFFTAWLRDAWRPEAVTDGLGEVWSVPDIFYKPYPANHFTHAGIDAAIELRRGGLRPEDVASAHLGVAGPTVRTIGEPLDVKQRPETGYQAQFSGPYTVAAALEGGGGLGLGLADFTDEAARDPRRRALMARITVGADPRCDAIYPAQFPASLTVHTTDGRTLEAFVAANRGGPERPLREDELVAKYADNVAGLLEPEVAEATRVACLGLGERRDVAGVLPARLPVSSGPGFR